MRCQEQVWDDGLGNWACTLDGLPCTRDRPWDKCPRVRRSAIPCPSCMESNDASPSRLVRDCRADEDVLACPVCGYAAQPGHCAADLLAAFRATSCAGRG